ncbi:MAG: hypothetical protein K2L96_02075 [Muribaculaceae bacterium]|nr:hypothetical protein [Muribaculaceae bacterium]
MADNYLENKMDEYRRGLLSAPARRKTTPSGHARGCACFLPFPPGLRVFVLTDRPDETELRALVDTGCRVAFTGRDKAEGTRLAQSCGAQYHPISAYDERAVKQSLELIKQRWRGEADVIVSHGHAIPTEYTGFRVGVGTGAGNVDIAFPADADVTMILWALLPQTRSYFT